MPATGNRYDSDKHKGQRKRYVAVMKKHKADKTSPEYQEAERKVRELDQPPAPRGADSKRI